MRALGLIILVLMIVATPVLAQDNGGPPSRNFGSVTCRQHIACPGSGGGMSATNLAANATACTSRYFTMQPGSGFFDTTMGLDSNGCLTSTTPPGDVGPRCCLIKLPDNSCTFHCVLSR